MSLTITKIKVAVCLGKTVAVIYYFTDHTHDPNPDDATIARQAFEDSKLNGVQSVIIYGRSPWATALLVEAAPPEILWLAHYIGEDKAVVVRNNRGGNPAVGQTVEFDLGIAASQE